MKLIEFKNKHGELVYINPDYVLCVKPYDLSDLPDSPTMASIFMVDAIVHVHGDPYDIANRLVRGTAI